MWHRKGDSVRGTVENWIWYAQGAWLWMGGRKERSKSGFASSLLTKLTEPSFLYTSWLIVLETLKTWGERKFGKILYFSFSLRQTSIGLFGHQFYFSVRDIKTGTHIKKYEMKIEIQNLFVSCQRRTRDWIIEETAHTVHPFPLTAHPELNFKVCLGRGRLFQLSWLNVGMHPGPATSSWDICISWLTLAL